MKILYTLLIATLFVASSAMAEQIQISMHRLTAQGVAEKIGTITAKLNANGTEFAPNLDHLTPGLHGFHVHQQANCGSAEKEGKTVPGLAAKGHFDPHKTAVHSGPLGDGHLGDLPPLSANDAGKALKSVYASRIKLSDLHGRALIIHAGGDNFSDQPKKLGGGGSRIACGIID